MQWTRSAALRSPLTPDVRRACAAPQLRTESPFWSVSNHADRQTRIARPSITIVHRTQPSLQQPTESVRGRLGTPLFPGPGSVSKPSFGAGSCHGLLRRPRAFNPRHSPQAQDLMMPTFTASAVSGSAPRAHRTHGAALGLSDVRRRPASASNRPVPIRSRLTPACSGLATLATDARR